MHAIRFAVVGLLLCAPKFALAATYYVDGTAGLNTNAGTTTKPWKTINRSLTQGLLAGDTVVVRAGTYNEALTITNQALASSPITFVAATGAKVIIDGKRTLPATATYGLIEITGAHIIIDGFEITGARGPGVQSTGKGTVVRNCTIHTNTQHAVLYYSVTDGRISNNTVYENVQANKNHNQSGPASAITVSVSQRIMVNGNKAYHNHGVGIDVDESSVLTLMDNTLYDNLIAGIAASKVSDITIDANFVYCTGDVKYNLQNERPLALTLGSLVKPAITTKKNLITNNIFARCSHNITWHMGAAGTGLKSTDIANNTLVQANSDGIAFENGATHTASTFTNNIVIQSNALLVNLGNRPTGLTFNYNNWLGGAPTGQLKGTGDLLANCNLPNVNGTAVADFKLPKASPCIDKGKTLADVKLDFFNTARPKGAAYDIGAHEYFAPPPKPDAGVPDAAITPDAAVNADSAVNADAAIVNADAAAKDLGDPPKGDGTIKSDVIIDPPKGDGNVVGDGSTASDASGLDQGSSKTDGGPVIGGDGKEKDDGGCGCAVSDVSAGAWPLFGLALLAVFGRRRRRR